MNPRPHHEDVRRIKRSIIRMIATRPATLSEIYRRLLRQHLIDRGQQTRVKNLIIRLMEEGFLRSVKIPGRRPSRLSQPLVRYQVAV